MFNFRVLSIIFQNYTSFTYFNFTLFSHYKSVSSVPQCICVASLEVYKSMFYTGLKQLTIQTITCMDNNPSIVTLSQLGSQGWHVVTGAWPWIVALGYKSSSSADVKFLCGSALITHKHVITAGHCVHGRRDL